ncbi:hypothetical protein Dimus_002887 [Dionaea muscipula]
MRDDSLSMPPSSSSVFPQRRVPLPNNICCVVVEYLPGVALKSYLIKNRRKKLPFKVVIQLALDLAGGLSYSHSREDHVHRCKDENMLLDKSRTLKIADFGFAHVEASNPSDMTRETGTLGYMAPEVCFHFITNFTTNQNGRLNISITNP